MNNEWFNTLLNGDYGLSVGWGPYATLFVMLLAFAIGHFIGFTYMWTHEAISYSRTYVAALAVMPVMVSMMMVVMSGNMLVAFGLLAVFGVIRFRNVLKDTRDTSFVLWAIMEGVMVGTMRFSTAVIGAAGIAVAMLYLRMTSFGTRHRYDAVVTLRMGGDPLLTHSRLKQVMRRHILRSTLVSERRASEGGIDVAYQLLMRDPSRLDELQVSLSKLDDLSNVAVFLHDDEAEI